ncbi:hypothetical protein D3C73_928610 [compost metagenome]
MGPQLIPQGIRRQSVFLKPSLRIQREQQLAVVDVVDIVFIPAVSADAAVLLNEIIHIVSDIIQVLAFACLLPEQLEAFQHHSVIIRPFPLVAPVLIQPRQALHD